MNMGSTIVEILPRAPSEGPPLPKGLGILWPAQVQAYKMPRFIRSVSMTYNQVVSKIAYH